MGRDKAPKPKSAKGGVGNKNGEELLDPREIRFTHSRIRPLFSCGRRVTETLDDVREKKITVAQLPRITVIQQDNMYYSMNNRRLYVFKQLREEGLLPGDKVPVRIKQAHEVRAADRFTPERCAFAAKFMNEPAARSNSANEDGAGGSSAPIRDEDEHSAGEGADASQKSSP